jgi:hypothetical protein
VLLPACITGALSQVDTQYLRVTTVKMKENQKLKETECAPTSAVTHQNSIGSCAKPLDYYSHLLE